MPTLQTLHHHLRWIALAAIAISVLTWAVDLAGLVYACPYCRSQRTVIGLLGALLLLPLPALGHWAVRWLATVLAVFGAQVASRQHFGGWSKLSAGEFALAQKWWIDPFLLSGIALFLITGLVLLLWSVPGRAGNTD